jgi:hypothetical protein
MIRAIRRAAICTGLGLLVQLAAALDWTPFTFIASTVIGLPLILVGGVLFLRAVWKSLKSGGAA